MGAPCFSWSLDLGAWGLPFKNRAHWGSRCAVPLCVWCWWKISCFLSPKRLSPRISDPPLFMYFLPADIIDDSLLRTKIRQPSQKLGRSQKKWDKIRCRFSSRQIPAPWKRSLQQCEVHRISVPKLEIPARSPAAHLLERRSLEGEISMG